MRKGERTREAILERAAELFNRQGYSGATLSDIMQATGLQKGGIYNHFLSKENLAVEAFDFVTKRISYRLVQAVKAHSSYYERLLAIVEFFRHYFESPPLVGGCIVLNTAIDSDDTNPALRQRAREVMDLWREMIRRTVTKGIDRGEIAPDVDADGLATLIISTLEGSLMMSKLYDDGIHTRRAVDYLREYIENRAKP